MRKVLIIGSGISGLCCAIECARLNMEAILVSPFPSERSQSVMAAGGINAVINTGGGDSISSHIEDTIKGGCDIAGQEAVGGLCAAAPGEKPYWQEFFYEKREEQSVAGMLDELNYKDDLKDMQGNPSPRIQWECSCLQGMCGACAMVINGVPALSAGD